LEFRTHVVRFLIYLLIALKQKLYLARNMTKRRDFLKIGALAVPSILLDWNTAKASPQEILRPGILNPKADWSDIRDAFSLKKDLLFLNNGTMGPSPKTVTQAVIDSMEKVNSQAHYGGWAKTNKVIADYFGAQADEICLTHNVTEGINIIAQGLPLKAGDEVIVSNQEHVGNALPWLSRARRDKLTIKVLDLTLPKEKLLQTIEEMIGPKTRVIALPHIPCTNGRVIPAQEIGEIAKRHSLYYFLDGAHGPGMLDLDFSQMNCDFYATCTHKWMLGPKGTGFLFIRKDKLEDVTPVFAGAYSDTGWNLIDGNPRIDGWADNASRFFNGTQNKALYDGVIEAVGFHKKLGKKNIASRIRELNDRLYNKLEARDGIQLITPKNERAGIAAFTFNELDYIKFQPFCVERNIIIRVVPENEVNAVRVSTHIYNSFEEIDTFVATLHDFLHG